MAIIQSILVGKGKGKIGNVVLSGLKGQTVAKQLNSSPSNPRTVAQTENRVKMANAVLAWQFLSQFFSYAKGIRKPLESVYNAFVRTIVSDMQTVLATSRAMAAAAALILENFSGNWFTIVIAGGGIDPLDIRFIASGVSWSPSYRIATIFFETATGNQIVEERALTEAEFNAGTVVLPYGEPGQGDVISAYIYDSATSKITNIAYFGI